MIRGETLAEEQTAFAAEWVSRDSFIQRYPVSLNAAEFVNRLFDAAGLRPYAEERQQQIDATITTGKTRAQVFAGFDRDR